MASSEIDATPPPQPPPQPQRRVDARRVAGTAVEPVPAGLVRLIVFLGGLSSIGIELAASRLVAPYFGDSTFIWANIIGLTLAFLSVGYWLGGRVADRYPRATVLYGVTAVAAFAAGLIPLVSRPILELSLAAFDQVAIGAFYGSLLAVLLLIAVPVTLLGFVTPYAIRLRLDDLARAGNTAGGVYALSTVGSIMGSFLPVLVLIPLFGTARTFLILALALLVPSVVALALLRALGPAAVGAGLGVALVTVSVAGQTANVRPAERGALLYETESAYNYIQVVEDDGARLLVLNEGHAVHSVYDPDDLLTRGPWDYFMLGPLFNRGAGPGAVDTDGGALLIGLAGGTVARQLTAAYGPVPIDGVELDPEIARVGREYFNMEAEAPGLTTIVEDGRYFLRTTDRRYDLIGVDAYRQPYIPFQLTSKEFFAEVADHLTAEGVAVINVGRADTDYRLVDAIASTMAAVYPHVFAVDVERYDNTILVGTMQPAGIGDLVANASALPEGILRTVAERSLATGDPRPIDPGGRVFTDDHAPVELVIDRIIVDEARDREEDQ
jgi:predicted membrane-bound spermidine synthase